jgi:hypothetical protein
MGLCSIKRLGIWGSRIKAKLLGKGLMMVLMVLQVI